MEQPLLVAVAVLAAVLVVGLAVILALVVRSARAGRRRLEQALSESRADLVALRARVDELAGRVAPEAATPQAAGRRTPAAREYLITALPDGSAASAADLAPVEPHRLGAGEFTSLAVGESLVRIVSFGYGVRRALTPENRNRIRFEVRREVRRSRKQRRRDLKEAKRDLRAQARTDLAEDAA